VLDATALEYEQSTQAAEASGFPSIFLRLAREAQAMLLMLQRARTQHSE
jgi:hypothetical protein